MNRSREKPGRLDGGPEGSGMVCQQDEGDARGRGMTLLTFGLHRVTAIHMGRRCPMMAGSLPTALGPLNRRRQPCSIHFWFCCLPYKRGGWDWSQRAD